MSAGALRIAVCCYPTFGGSGVIATEIALGMAARGHRVHLFAYDRPARLGPDVGDAPDGLTFHRVEPRDYPVFHQPPYELALASRLVDVAHREGLDVVHVHYAVPHATCAFLAKSMLAAEGVAARDLPRVVTTLHGTDITLVGSDASYRPITRFSIAASDVVTTPSAWLRDTTRALLGLEAQAIEVVPNFVDVHRFAPPPPSSTSRARPAQDGVARLVHVSNFRAVKRVPDVVRVFAGVRAARPAHLTLVGDGPARAEAEALADALGVRADVTFAGELHEVRGLLAEADLFLMPSASESFGVAALEAQAMGVPVIASDAGGLPEVVAHGETGWLLPIGDVAGMTAAALRLLDAPALWHRLAHAARARAVARFEMQAVLDRYEALYRASLR